MHNCSANCIESVSLYSTYKNYLAINEFEGLIYVKKVLSLLSKNKDNISGPSFKGISANRFGRMGELSSRAIRNTEQIFWGIS